MRFKLLHIIFSTLIVVAFGWGSTYLVMKGMELTKPSVVVVSGTPQKAAATEITVATTSTSKKVTSTNNVSAKNATNGITILIGGDVMFDRGIRAIGTRNGYNSLFDESITSLLKSADVAVVNLEGPITSYPSKTLIDGKTTDSFTFNFHPLSHLSLKEAGIDIVSLANNHTDNMNLIGFIETQDWLEDAGILWFGNPWNSTSTKITRRARVGDDSPITKLVEIRGIRIAFVGYHAFQSGMMRVIEEIKRIEDPEVFTILMPHWGEEYISKPSPTLKSQARAFIEAGADAVIGAHPHVIMENEWVDDVPVYYSLGNLLFDQYFSKEVMNGLVVELHVVNDGSKTYLDKVGTYENYLVKGVGTSLVEPQQ